MGVNPSKICMEKLQRIHRKFCGAPICVKNLKTSWCVLGELWILARSQAAKNSPFVIIFPASYAHFKDKVKTEPRIGGLADRLAIYKLLTDLLKASKKIQILNKYGLDVRCTAGTIVIVSSTARLRYDLITWRFLFLRRTSTVRKTYKRESGLKKKDVEGSE